MAFFHRHKPLSRNNYMYSVKKEKETGRDFYDWSPEEKEKWYAEEPIREKKKMDRQIHTQLINELNHNGVINSDIIGLFKLTNLDGKDALEGLSEGLIWKYKGSILQIEVDYENGVAYLQGEVNGQSWPPKKEIGIKKGIFMDSSIVDLYKNLISVFKVKVDQSGTRMASLRRRRRYY